MKKSDLQEQLATLYLRLNGYFVSGFIVHAPEGEMNRRGQHRSNRTEIDCLAVRFPHNNEPEREIGTSDYFQTSDIFTDLVICEVKGQQEDLQFNRGLRSNIDAVRSVLRWAGMFSEEELSELVQPVQALLLQPTLPSPENFRELTTAKNFRIRAIHFAPDRSAPTHQQVRYVHGQEMIHYIWQCLQPERSRIMSQTRYDFGLWGEYEKIVRFFKAADQKPDEIEQIYQAILRV